MRLVEGMTVRRFGRGHAVEAKHSANAGLFVRVCMNIERHHRIIDFSLNVGNGYSFTVIGNRRRDRETVVVRSDGFIHGRRDLVLE